MTGWVLTLNAGSSSLKVARFEVVQGRVLPRASGQIEGLAASAHLLLRTACGQTLEDRKLPAGEGGTPAAALELVLPALLRNFPEAEISAVGHRVVHGWVHLAAPILVDHAVLAELRTLEPLAPLQQPHNIAGILAAKAAFPDARQAACFDRAFHRADPWVADTFPLPPAYYDKGVRRYGFHRLSYESVTRQLRAAAPQAAAGRMVVAHLGSGASLCAIRNGRSLGSTMGFFALDGLPMGTRCGQLDPGVLLYLMEQEGMTAGEISDLLYNDSGLMGDVGHQRRYAAS